MPQSAKERPYHHGNLRQSLIDAALELIAEKQDAKTLSLREVARRVGVSHAAPYRHFADKEALLAAVAEEGFHLLLDYLHRAMVHIDEPARRLQASGVGYVRFAIAHPSHYRVMFSTLQVDYLNYPGLNEAGAKAFAVMVDEIMAGQAAGQMKTGDPQQLAWVSWSLVHGLSMLLIEHQLPLTDEQDIEALAEFATQSSMEGLCLGDGP